MTVSKHVRDYIQDKYQVDGMQHWAGHWITHLKDYSIAVYDESLSIIHYKSKSYATLYYSDPHFFEGLNEFLHGFHHNKVFDQHIDE